MAIKTSKTVVGAEYDTLVEHDDGFISITQGEDVISSLSPDEAEDLIIALRAVIDDCRANQTPDPVRGFAAGVDSKGGA